MSPTEPEEVNCAHTALQLTACQTPHPVLMPGSTRYLPRMGTSALKWNNRPCIKLFFLRYRSVAFVVFMSDQLFGGQWWTYQQQLCGRGLHLCRFNQPKTALGKLTRTPHVRKISHVTYSCSVKLVLLQIDRSVVIFVSEFFYNEALIAPKYISSLHLPELFCHLKIPSCHGFKSFILDYKDLHLISSF